LTALPLAGAPRRVGLVLLTAVGDVVHALPVVNALKRRWPTAHVSWVLQPGPASLVDGHSSVDEVLRFDRGRGLRGFLDVRRLLRDRPFDLVLVLQPYLKAGIIAGFASAPIKLGYDRARARDATWAFTTHRLAAHPPQHVQDEYLEFLAALGVDAQPMAWGLGPTPDERTWWEREFLPRTDRPYAAFVIGTSKPKKDWFADRWARLADVLAADFGLQTVLVGGQSPRELETAAQIARHAARPVTNALGSGLRRLVAILDGAALVVSPDTGPLHMAVALDRPTIALMGYTNPKRTGPYRRFHDLMVDAYGDPDEDYPLDHRTRPGRMSRIRVDDVVLRVGLWRSRYAG
jgi:heptosyltransferase I